MATTLVQVRTKRAAKALQELSNAAMENGTSEITLDEINADIEAVRISSISP